MFFCKKNNLNLFLFFSFITNLSFTFANLDSNININEIKLENDRGQIVINLVQNSTLSPKIIELLERGIPIAFNLHIDLIKENNFWFDKVINQNIFVYQIKYYSLRKVFEVVDTNGNKKNFKDEKRAIKNLLGNKEIKIKIKKNKHLDNSKLKIWIELDKKKLPNAIKVDVFNKSWDMRSNIIFYDVKKL